MSDQPPSNPFGDDLPKPPSSGGFSGDAGPPPPPPPPSTSDWGTGPQDRVPGRAPQLRQMALGEVIDASITLYRENWQVLAGLVAIFVVPLEIVNVILGNIGSWPAIGLAAVLGFLVGPILGGAVSKAAADLYLDRKPDIGSALSFTVARFGPLLAVTLLTLVAISLGLLLLIVPGLILMVRLYFGSVVVVLEGSPAVESMRRSVELTKGHFWRLVGAAFVIFVIVAIVATVLQLPFLFIVGESAVATAFISAVVNILVTPFSAVAAVLLYFDLRVRKEAFDLQVLADHLRGPGGHGNIGNTGTPGQPW